MRQREDGLKTKKTPRDLTPHTILRMSSGDFTMMYQSLSQGKKILPLGSEVSTNRSSKIDIAIYSPPEMALWDKIATLKY